MGIIFTGLPCAGKTTAADRLAARVPRPFRLDSDTVAALFPWLGYSTAERVQRCEMAARLAATARDAGAFPVLSMVAPTRACRHAFRVVGLRVVILRTNYGTRPPHWYPPEWEEPEGWEEVVTDPAQLDAIGADMARAAKPR